MRNFYHNRILTCAIFAMLPGLVHAAGTYYTGNYRSPQQNYSQMNYATRSAGRTTSYNRDTTYTRTRTMVQPNDNAYIGTNYSKYTAVQQKQENVQQKSDKGLYLGVGLSHEFANWEFNMKTAGSKLHYDNLRWNILDVNGVYNFDIGNTPVQIDAGVRYGLQWGDSTMVDDDITNGGQVVTIWWDDNGTEQTSDDIYIGKEMGKSLSVGTTNDGNLLGFHAGFGLTDFWRSGKWSFTPSVGFRYLKYKLETKQNYGLTVDTGYCGSGSLADETQCQPIAIMIRPNSENYMIAEQQVLWGQNIDGYYTVDPSWWGTGDWFNPDGSINPDYEGWLPGISTGGTYMFKLPSVSHSYETTWMGPYLAMDMDYAINSDNALNARVEFGLPLYKSTGDQPYRIDWQHPKSVEDEGSFGDAWHFGLGANYMTSLTDSVAMTFGLTFDYYSMSGAKAKTYFNSSYYMPIYNSVLQAYVNDGVPVASAETCALNGCTVVNTITSDETSYNPDDTARYINELRSKGWVAEVSDEIESIYKSMGLRIGIQAKF